MCLAPQEPEDQFLYLTMNDISAFDAKQLLKVNIFKGVKDSVHSKEIMGRAMLKVDKVSGAGGLGCEGGCEGGCEAGCEGCDECGGGGGCGAVLVEVRRPEVVKVGRGRGPRQKVRAMLLCRPAGKQAMQPGRLGRLCYVHPMHTSFPLFCALCIPRGA